MSLPPTSSFAGYRVDRELGRGGMGVVYRAYEEELERWVALKVMSRDCSEDPEFRERFGREAAAAARVEHPNVVPIFRYSRTDPLFLVMRLVVGTDLRRLLAAGRTVPMASPGTGFAMPMASPGTGFAMPMALPGTGLAPPRTLAVLRQVAGALDAAHHVGVVHRDVKPANILLQEPAAPGRPEHAYLTDFGLAVPATAGGSDRLTQTGLFVGTAEYMSPEHAAGEPAGPASDIYSLGCVLYECLSGRLPFEGASAFGILTAHRTAPRPRISDVRPDLPPALDDVFAVCLATEPAARFRTAGDVVDAAADALDLAPVRLMRPVPPRRGGRRSAVLPAAAPVPAPPAAAPVPASRPVPAQEGPAPPGVVLPQAPAASTTVLPGAPAASTTVLPQAPAASTTVLPQAPAASTTVLPQAPAALAGPVPPQASAGPTTPPAGARPAAGTVAPIGPRPPRGAPPAGAPSAASRPPPSPAAGSAPRLAPRAGAPQPVRTARGLGLLLVAAVAGAVAYTGYHWGSAGSGSGGSPAQDAQPTAEQVLIGRLPPETYGACRSNPQALRPGVTAAVSCSPAQSGADQLLVAGYDTEALLTRAYRSTATSRHLRAGRCSTGSGYDSTWAGGRLACYTNSNADAVLLWQYRRDKIMVAAVRKDDAARPLYSWWRTAVRTPLRG